MSALWPPSKKRVGLWIFDHIHPSPEFICLSAQTILPQTYFLTNYVIFQYCLINVQGIFDFVRFRLILSWARILYQIFKKVIENIFIFYFRNLIINFVPIKCSFRMIFKESHKRNFNNKTWYLSKFFNNFKFDYHSKWIDLNSNNATNYIFLNLRLIFFKIKY